MVSMRYIIPAVADVATSRASIVEASEGVVVSGVIAAAKAEAEDIAVVVASVETVGEKAVIVAVEEVDHEVIGDVEIEGVVTLPPHRLRPRFASILQNLTRAHFTANFVLGRSCFTMVAKTLCSVIVLRI